MLTLASRLPLYWTFRRFGWPKLYPFSLVVSVSFRCNSKCRTCDVWRKTNDDMTVEEWDQVFAHLGRTPFYITFTGGEPFLRKDLDEMVLSAYRRCHPAVITIPTNGLLTDRVAERVERICRECPGSQIGINLSLDGIGDEHDDIRGVAGNWERSIATWEKLKILQRAYPNLVLSVHTVVSRFNQDRFRAIYDGLQSLEPDSYITEVAEERVELDTVGWGITPDPESYAPIADFLSEQARARPAKGLARFTQAFRAQYYQLAGAYSRSGPRSSPAMPAGPARISRRMAISGVAAFVPRGSATCAVPAMTWHRSGSVSRWRVFAGPSTTRNAPARWPTQAMPICCYTRRPSPG